MKPLALVLLIIWASELSRGVEDEMNLLVSSIATVFTQRRIDSPCNLTPLWNLHTSEICFCQDVGQASLGQRGDVSSPTSHQGEWLHLLWTMEWRYHLCISAALQLQSEFCWCFVMCRRLASKAIVCRSHSVSKNLNVGWQSGHKFKKNPRAAAIAKYLEMTRVPKTWRSGSSKSFSVHRSWELPEHRAGEEDVRVCGLHKVATNYQIKYQTHNSHDQTQKKKAKSVQSKHDWNPNSCGRPGQRWLLAWPGLRWHGGTALLGVHGQRLVPDLFWSLWHWSLQLYHTFLANKRTLYVCTFVPEWLSQES